jgi:RNA polymerase sigma-70 factor (ECF subfamily)
MTATVPLPPATRAVPAAQAVPAVPTVDTPTEGAAEAWARVLDGCRGDLVRSARARLGGGGADAEDVVHDVVVRVLRRGRHAGDVGAPGAYLRRAVGNECISRWRRTAAEVVVADLPDRSRPAHDDAVLDRLALADAVATLTDRQRGVIVLTVLDDRPDAEVAELLGISEVTVRTTRSRALARLRTRLTADEPAGSAKVADITTARRAPLRVPA